MREASPQKETLADWLELPVGGTGGKKYKDFLKGWGRVSREVTDSEGRNALINAIGDLEDSILNKVKLECDRTADSYGLLATAAGLTPWWKELARLAVDTISAVV